VADEYHEDVEAGLVTVVGYAEEPIDGQLPEGAAINMLVSAGPFPRTLPGVAAGAGYDSVAADLQADGLVPERVDEPSETVPEGVVIRTEPGEGEQVARGSTVRVVVSSGLPFVTVPDVLGMEEDEAIDVLEAAGLVVGDSFGPPNRPVLFTDPEPGASVRKGTVVTIYTRST
jgi:hypothetical protein